MRLTTGIFIVTVIPTTIMDIPVQRKVIFSFPDVRIDCAFFKHFPLNNRYELCFLLTDTLHPRFINKHSYFSSDILVSLTPLIRYAQISCRHVQAHLLGRQPLSTQFTIPRHAGRFRAAKTCVSSRLAYLYQGLKSRVKQRINDLNLIGWLVWGFTLL